MDFAIDAIILPSGKTARGQRRLSFSPFHLLTFLPSHLSTFSSFHLLTFSPLRLCVKSHFPQAFPSSWAAFRLICPVKSTNYQAMATQDRRRIADNIDRKRGHMGMAMRKTNRVHNQ